MRRELEPGQGDVATRTGFPRYQPIPLYERGENAVAMKRYIDYAEALETEPETLVRAFLEHYEPTLHALLFEEV